MCHARRTTVLFVLISLWRLIGLSKRRPMCVQVNDKYTGTFVFDNDFPSLELTMPVPTEEDQPGHPLLRFGEARGEW